MSARAGTPLAEIEARLAENHQQLAFEPPGLRVAVGRRARAGHDRRRVRLQSRRSAPDQGRRRARPLPWRAGGHRARRSDQVRRASGQERHRLRSVQAVRRQLRHARCHDRGDLQGAAGGRARVHAPAARSDACGGFRGPAHGHEPAPATSAAPPFCRPRRPAVRRSPEWRGPQPILSRCASKGRRHRCASAPPACRHCSRRMVRSRSSRRPRARRCGARSGMSLCCRRCRHSGASRFPPLPARRWSTELERHLGARVARRLGRRSAVAGDRRRDRRRRGADPRGARAGGGHATLVRASAELRRAVPVFQPQEPALARLSARVKDSFDPKRILNRGRMYPDV